jgi:hypothetical protein
MNMPTYQLPRPLAASLAALAAMAVLFPLAAPAFSSSIPTVPRTPASAPQAAPSQPLPPQTAASSQPPMPLDTLLAKAAEYCRKLESSALDFVCREEISETIDPKLDVDRKTPPPDPGWTNYSGPTLTIRRALKVKRRFVYDYQCVRAGRTIRELRTQLEEDGKKKVVPNAELRTSVVVYGTALLAPVGLFGERFQPDYDFTIAGGEKVGKKTAVVVDARPKPGVPPTRNLYGKAWLDAATGDILKIEWSESRVGRFEVFEKRAQIYDRTPRLVISSEFSAEKNGIRFPSRLEVEEAYLNEAGKAFVRSRTAVVYKDFKFFTVEYEARD